MAELIDYLLFALFIYVFLRMFRGSGTEKGDAPRTADPRGAGQPPAREERGLEARPGPRVEPRAGAAGTSTRERSGSLLDVLREWEVEQRRRESEREAPEPLDRQRRRDLAERKRRDRARRREAERRERAVRVERELEERSRPLEEWAQETEVVSLETEPPAPVSWDEDPSAAPEPSAAVAETAGPPREARRERGEVRQPGRPERRRRAVIYEDEVGAGAAGPIATGPETAGAEPEPAARRGISERRGPPSRNPLAALEGRPPLQRAILYGEVLGPPRGFRPDEEPATRRPRA